MKTAAAACLIALAAIATPAGVAGQDDALKAPRPAPPAARASTTPNPSDLGAAMMSAEVDADGTLLIGEGAVSSVRTGNGQYQVGFGRDVRNCAFSATNQSVSGAPPFVQKYGVEWPEGIFVGHLEGGAYSNARFYLIAVCGR
ncbi:hypothetical protein [Methylopila turkensis]|uniref:Uncharacterized protein n=1 Tax=Methylopila turkensis TaxID=1437816 RepID=A0A9W6N7U5_9HYPH|nr:hypothetical protein [Methylopila turkensis]GLK80878.1 hypothetical protein GCM10008174_26190 [Methylopila turkensis]